MTDANLFMTHWPGCWKGSHPACAEALIEKAEEVIVDMLVDSTPYEAAKAAQRWMMWKNGPRASVPIRTTAGED